MIGIIGAMEEEVSLLKDKMQDVKVSKKASMEFFQGKVFEKELVVVKSGIGKVNASICAQILVDLFHVDTIINTGVAGSLQNDINIGDIVLSSDTMQHDMDATNFGYEVGVIPRMEMSIFKADQCLLEKAQSKCKEVNPDINVFVGRVVSGDQFVSDASKKTWLVDTFSALCTEMEGAAIGQVAYLNKIPFLVIRAISDKADNSASMDYEEFVKQAIKHTINLIEAILQ